MEDSPLAKESTFPDQYLSAIRRLQSQDFPQSVSSGLTSGSRSSRIKAGRGNLSAIAKVAAAGLSSMSASTVLDQVLALESLPELEEGKE